jgi:ankyrin repeat protein
MNDSQKSFLKNLVHKDTVQFAIESGNLQLLKSLIEKGAEIPDDSVSSAAAEGHLDIIKYLVDEKGIEIGHSFWYASHNGHFPVMEYLFSKGVTIGDSGDAVNFTFARGNSSRLEVVKYLIEKGAKIDHESVSFAIADGGVISFASVKYLIDEKGAKISDDAVYNAVLKGSLQIVKYLVEKGADVTEGILGTAAHEGHFDIVKYLVDEKGLGDLSKHDYDLSNMGDAAAEGAAENGHLEILKYIVEKFSVVWGDGDENGDEPPMCQRLAYHLPKATRNGHFEIVKYLFEKGAWFIYDDEIGNVIYHTAKNGHLEIVKYLVEKFAKTSDDYLEALRFIEIVEFLEEEGLSRCEALSIYNKIEAGELNFPEYTRWGIEVS